MTKTLVVDACVATSASEKNVPVSKMSRVFLDELLKSKIKIAMDQQLRKEWMDHKSKYTLIVLSSLISRNRVIFINSREEEIGNIDEDIEERIRDKQRINAIKKDLHLINLALLTDKIIISNDNRARNHFCYIVEDFPILEKLMWLNPTIEEEEPYKWIVNGANFEVSKTLKSYSQTK